MTANILKILNKPSLDKATMLLAFSGWMDGGDVSTGTVRRLIDKLDARPIAEIDPQGFYIYNVPGAMEVAALFRPHIKIQDGLIQSFDLPRNRFYCDEKNNLVFFVGKEPNLNWQLFGDCIFDLAAQIGVSTILFVGSFGGNVPHTREPRLFATVSDASLKPMLEQYGVRATDYEGPGSFTTCLLTQATGRGMAMASLVAEIPAYLHGTNPLSIEAVTRRLAHILGIKADLAQLRSVSNAWESQVSKAVEKDDDLARKIRELEKQYDDELIETPLAGNQTDDNEV